MSGSPNGAVWRPFIAGVATALTAVYLWESRPQNRRREYDNREILSNDDNVTSRSNNNHGEHQNQQNSNQKQRQQQQLDSTQRNGINNTESKDVNDETTDFVWDTPNLDQRMIRKAEAAILGRTSRLVVVVERCTNDHNYSAILRTAEALGIQHVCIIAPPPPTTTTTAPQFIDKNGTANDDDNDDDESSETQAASSSLPSKTTTTTTTKQQVKKQGSNQHPHAATPEEVEERQKHHLFAQNATEWLTLHEFRDTTSCIKWLKETGHDLWVTDLSQEAVCLTHEGLLLASKNNNSNNNNNNNINETNNERMLLFPEKVAIVFGTEAVGCTTEMLEAADLRVYLPLRGWADSLNLSVATALVIHQLFVLDPSLAGSMTQEERSELRRLWFPKLAKQRIMTSSQKRLRQRLVYKVRHCRDILCKKQREGVESLNQNQVEKLKQYDELQRELDALDAVLDDKAFKAVAHVVNNPPAPLSDMRRADEHRVCFVGPKTKKKYKGIWDDMPATANYTSTYESTAGFFKSRLEEDDESTKKNKTK